jgi:hypothetical protein
MASKIESIHCGGRSRVVPLLLDPARRMLMAAAFFAVLSSASAVDPLPPELETAPLKQQAEWRARMGRESMSERKQVAERRHEQRLALKKTILAGIHSEAADRRMSVLSPVPAPLPVVESGIATPGEIRWTVILVILFAAGFLVRRWIQHSRTARS